MIHLFKDTFVDPFRTDNAFDHLVNFISGVVTTPAIKRKSTKSLRHRNSHSYQLHEAAFKTDTR